MNKDIIMMKEMDKVKILPNRKIKALQQTKESKKLNNKGRKRKLYH